MRQVRTTEPLLIAADARRAAEARGLRGRGQAAGGLDEGVADARSAACVVASLALSTSNALSAALAASLMASPTIAEPTAPSLLVRQ
jgi:hypothetical protein